jgi:hypothetical protein
MKIMPPPSQERGCAGRCCGGGVLVNMFINTPLHPSQEGNRTARTFNFDPSIAIQSQNKIYLLIFNKCKKNFTYLYLLIFNK